MFRVSVAGLEVLLAHPGGPLYARKDEGCWTLPKGEVAAGEDPLAAAIREFTEETGIAPSGECLPLGSVRLRSGKVIHAWAFRGDRHAARPIRSNRFTIEWPPRSGRFREFPEIDRAEFFPLPVAYRKVHPAQRPFLDRLAARLGPEGAPTAA
jgi:predicted NUDIX family NTP pyrophosphohydrolase